MPRRARARDGNPIIIITRHRVGWICRKFLQMARSGRGGGRRNTSRGIVNRVLKNVPPLAKFARGAITVSLPISDREIMSRNYAASRRLFSARIVSAKAIIVVLPVPVAFSSSPPFPFCPLFFFFFLSSPSRPSQPRTTTALSAFLNPFSLVMKF